MALIYFKKFGTNQEFYLPEAAIQSIIQYRDKEFDTLYVHQEYSSALQEIISIENPVFGTMSVKKPIEIQISEWWAGRRGQGA